MEVKNKKVIITGGANGIGKEITKQLIKSGALVTAVDINKDSLNNLKKELNSEQLTTFSVDVSKKEALINFKNNYQEKVGEVDILINNAGIIQPFIPINELEDETIKKVMDINFYGPLNLIRLFYDDLYNKKEKYIVNVSSMGGFFPFPHQSIYGASKAAIKLLTEGLYAESQNTNTRIMVVFPGAIATNIMKNSNVKMNANPENSSYKMTSASDTAKCIVDGIKNNKFKLYIGSDSKFMNFLYKINSKFAIDYICKKMKNLK